uniref:Thioesterase n=1 Tax=Legionella pneumophila TaxID=446 RepID=UPI000859AD35|nr:Chain A, Thioesterase [Legionella pneumophila]5DIO_B Chain B, Thioesterase [Legionella pneumophila]
SNAMTEINKIIHKKTFDIAWGDMAALGHVNNARYFDYFQEARIDWLRELDIKMTGQTGPVVIHVACTFLKPIVYPATVTIHSKVNSLGNSSMIMDHDLYQEETLMAQGVSKIVWIDYTQNKSVPLPDIIRNLV